MKRALMCVRNVGIHTVGEGLKAWRVAKMKNPKHACGKCILTNDKLTNKNKIANVKQKYFWSIYQHMCAHLRIKAKLKR